MSVNGNVETVKTAWAHLGAGELDELAGLYADEMVFALPGQADELHGRSAFRSALDQIGAALPPGFDIKNLRYLEGDYEVVNIVEWTSKALPNGTQSAILWKFDDVGKITEERWFVDTEQWKVAF
jgi:ketosteroid isomerase-like protein